MASSRPSSASAYSDFFASGLRAMARSRPESRGGAESPTPSNAVKTSARFSVLRGLARRVSTSTRTSSPPSVPSSPRPSLSLSIISAPAPSSPLVPAKCRPQVEQGQQQHHHRRRSSLIGLPTRILQLGRRNSSASTDSEWYLAGAEIPTRGRPGGSYHKPPSRNAHATAPDGIYLMRTHAYTNADVVTDAGGLDVDDDADADSDSDADPFNASPYASSFFTVDVDGPVARTAPTASPRPAPTTPAGRRLSFLALPTAMGIFRNHKREQRPRPAARRLSLPPVLRIDDKYDSSSVWPVPVIPLFLAEEDEQEPSPLSSVEYELDPVGAMDWRQFHAELIREEDEEIYW